MPSKDKIFPEDWLANFICKKDGHSKMKKGNPSDKQRVNVLVCTQKGKVSATQERMEKGEKTGQKLQQNLKGGRCAGVKE